MPRAARPERAHHGYATLPMTGHFYERLGYGTERPGGRRDWLVIYTLAGAGRFTHAQGEFLAHEHDVVLIKPGTPHGYFAVQSDPPWDLLWAHFLPPAPWHVFLDWPEVSPGMMMLHLQSPDAQRRAVAALEEAVRLMRGYVSRQSQLAMSSIETALLWCDTQNPHTQRGRLDVRIRTAMDQLSRNLQQRFTLAGMARLCHLSPSRFAHLFKQQTGQTPIHFLEQQRMARARELLELTSYPVAQVAEMVGYDSAFYFTRRFTLASGMSPRMYRRRTARLQSA